MRRRVGMFLRRTGLLWLIWLCVVSGTDACAGAFQIAEEPTSDPTVAAVRQHLHAHGHLQVWTTVLTELFALPTDVTVTLAPCGHIDAFYHPARRRIYLCDELLAYFARALVPPGARPDATAPAVRDATLFTFFHVVGHALMQVLDLPVTAPGEEVADEIGAVFLVVGNAPDEQAVLAGSQALFQRSRTPESPRQVPFWALHPWTPRRYTHLRCLLYGSNPAQHAALLEDGTLTAAHAQQCPATWQRQQRYWHTALAPYLRAPAPAAPREPAALPESAVSTLETSAPEQVLRTYYDAINQRQYAHTWLMLAPQFKQKHLCCEADGTYQFARYRAWWESVARVDLLSATVHERQPHAVVVRTVLRYTMKDGRVTEEIHLFSLMEEPATQRWFIVDQSRGVLRRRAP